MDRSTAIDRLPEAYANALRLYDQGHNDQAIAACFGIAPEPVGPLLRLSAAKLHSMLAANDERT